MATIVNDYNFEKVFYDKAEKHIGTLGIDYLQNYLVNGLASKTILLLTNKRLYQRGDAFEKTPKGYIRVKTEKVIDIKDITGTSFQSVDPIIIKICAWVCLVIAVLCLVDIGLGINDGFLYFSFILCTATAIFLFWAHGKSVRKFFIVEYAGGYIATDSSAYNQEEIGNFQKQISNIKDTHNYKPEPTTLLNNNINTGNRSSKESRIKELSDLLNKELITPDEFTEMKRTIILSE